MPAGLLPNEGIGDQLAYILSATITGVLDWQLVLFTNDLVVTADTVFADLVEATWAGYSRKTLTRADWQTPSVTSPNCATSVYGTSPIIYYVGSVPDNTINYGCAYLDPTTGLLRWIQRFDDGDITVLTSGGQFSIQPVYSLTSAAC